MGSARDRLSGNRRPRLQCCGRMSDSRATGDVRLYAMGHSRGKRGSILKSPSQVVQVSMTYVGKVYEAWLLDDGKLQWDDGDVWTCGPVSCCDAKFDGDWGCASIRNGLLTWKEGEEVAITIIKPTSFRMTYVGKVHEAWLLDDGELQWDDGDVWVRRGEEVAEGLRQTLNTAQAEVKVLDSRASCRRSRVPCDQRRKQNTVPECQNASSQMPDTTSASVSRPSEEPRRKEPAENVLSYAAVAISQASIGDCARQMRGRSVIVSEPVSKTRYEGQIKWFRGTYGWVYSPDLQKQCDGADVFLHINDCGDGFRPRQGDAVTFLLSNDAKGNPKAVQARPPVMIDAREWFEKRQRLARR